MLSLPMPVWTGLFFIGLVAVVVFAIRDPIWWTLAAMYVYFAIPIVEFNAPSAPYQAAFFALGIFFAIFYYQKYSTWAEDEIYRQAEEVSKRAIDEVRKPVEEALITAVLQEKMPGEIRGAMAEVGESKAVEIVERDCPKPLTVVVRRGVQTTLTQTFHQVETEALQVIERSGARTKGNLRVVLEARAVPLLHETLDKQREANVKSNVQELLEQDKREARDRPGNVGPLDMPLPKGLVGGVLSNVGIWAHVLFTIITYVFAHQALYDKEVGLSRVPTCVLLLIPLIGIVAAIRTDRHFWMGVVAWMFGTFHICWNGVTYWIQNGGRADNAGGQGGESNFLGGIICMVGPVAFSLALNGKEKLHRRIALGTAGAYVLGVLASGSRAGLLALIAGLGYWMTQTTKKAVAIGLLVIAGSCFLMVAPADFWQKMATIVEPTGANPWVEHIVEPSKHERIVLWDLAIKIWKEHPITGIGPLNYVRVSAEETEFTGAYTGKRGLQAHSTWLQLLAEYGLVGGVVWGGMYFLSILCYIRARFKMKKYKGYEWFGAICVGLEAGALAHAITLAFNSFQWYDYIYWHFVFGPLALEVANYTSARLEWMQPGDYLDARPPPRYGPPKTDGLDIDQIDLMDVAPLEVGSRTG